MIGQGQPWKSSCNRFVVAGVAFIQPTSTSHLQPTALTLTILNAVTSNKMKIAAINRFFCGVLLACNVRYIVNFQCNCEWWRIVDGA